MRTAATVTLVLSMTFFAACKGSETQPAANDPDSGSIAAPADLTPEQLGELGAKIRKDPARADELLTSRGLTKETFEKAIRDVTEDPEASRRYAEAYRKASA